jgi:glycerate 2-kinase
MPLKILILPDKFKGTLTAEAAADAIAVGWLRARPNDSLEKLPMSDGGDGFGKILGALIQAKVQTVAAIDAAHRPCKVRWWWEPKTKTAVIESAAIIGLSMLPPGRFHPFQLDTFGLGAVIKAAAAKGAKRCLMGIGGSATNDGGFGLARSLGWKFIDQEGKQIERWIDLNRLVHIRVPRRRAWFDDLVVAVDVQNPLMGRRGATRVYGPQKGLHAEDFDLTEQCLRRLANVLKEALSMHCALKPGAGAAGGLGFGLMSFLSARLEAGFSLFAAHANLNDKMRQADLVITGEGSIDASTLMGKGVGQIALCSRKLKIPCIGLGGMVTTRTLQKIFSYTSALTSLTTVDRAKAQPALWLERLANHSAKTWSATSGNSL